MSRILNTFFTITITCFFAPMQMQAQKQEQQSIPSLKEIFKNEFLIGTALNTSQILEKDLSADKLITQQFSAATPENIMKAEIIHPTWNQFDFTLADKLVEYGRKNNIKINGHTLIWHSQLPRFVRQIKNPDSLAQYFANHITTIASHFDGRVFSWDVVNEALEENGSLRKSIFLQQLGENYIVEAFRLAQQAAPHTELYYNDYNIEQPKKRAGAIEIIKKIKAAGVRIDGVGIQGHWRATHIPLAEIEQSILDFAALGVKVMFTELDLSVLPNPWDADNADVSATAVNSKDKDPYPNGLPDSMQTVLAKGYEDLFRLFLKHKDKISRITFWGVNDGQSWLNNFPIRGRTNYPTLFDRAYKAKPAFYAVVATKK